MRAEEEGDQNDWNKYILSMHTLRKLVAHLEEAKQSIGGRGICRCTRRVALLCSERRALPHCTMLNRDSEERGALNFFPKVKTSIIPSARDIIEINLNLGPNSACRV